MEVVKRGFPYLIKILISWREIAHIPTVLECLGYQLLTKLGLAESPTTFKHIEPLPVVQQKLLVQMRSG
jgi:hypothetical protein